MKTNSNKKRTRRWVKALTIAVLSLVAGSALADQVQVWSGWMNIVPCTTVEWNNDGLFGTPSPTLRTAPQELAGSISVDVSAPQELLNQVTNDVTDCGLEAAAVTTAEAILTSGAGGWESFTTTFSTCLSTRAESFQYVGEIHLDVDTKCDW